MAHSLARCHQLQVLEDSKLLRSLLTIVGWSGVVRDVILKCCCLSAFSSDFDKINSFSLLNTTLHFEFNSIEAHCAPLHRLLSCSTKMVYDRLIWQVFVRNRLFLAQIVFTSYFFCSNLKLDPQN